MTDSFDCKREFDTESIVLGFILNTFATKEKTAKKYGKDNRTTY